MKLVLFFSSLFAALAWLLPNHYQPWLGAYQNACAFLSLVLFLVYLQRSSPLLVHSKQFIAVAVLFLIIELQVAFGVVAYWGEAVIFCLYLFGFTGAVVAGQTLVSNTVLMNKLLFGFAVLISIVAVISSWLAIRQWLMLNGSIWVADMPPGGRPFANFGQPNSLATFLGMGLVSLLYLYERHYLQRLSASFLALLFIVGLALAQSRTTWISAVVIMLFWAWKTRSLSFSPRLNLRYLLLWLAVFVVILMIMPLINQWLLLSAPDLIQRAGSATRLNMYQQFMLAIWHGPWFGYGIGQVAEAQLAITPLHAHHEMTFYTHNIVLDTLIWFGPIIGALITFAAAAWVVGLAISARSKESICALIAACFILIHSLLEYPHAYAFFLLPLGFFLGIAQGHASLKNAITIPKKLTLSILCSGFILGSWVCYEYIIIENDFRLMRFETAGIGTLRAEIITPDVYVLNQLREYTRLARTKNHNQMSIKELESMRIAAHHYPFSDSLMHYTKALALNGYTNEAIDELALIKAMHKKHYFVSMLYWLDANTDAYPSFQTIINHFNPDNEE